jgi:hypothetical protein
MPSRTHAASSRPGDGIALWDVATAIPIRTIMLSRGPAPASHLHHLPGAAVAAGMAEALGAGGGVHLGGHLKAAKFFPLNYNLALVGHSVHRACPTQMPRVRHILAHHLGWGWCWSGTLLVASPDRVTHGGHRWARPPASLKYTTAQQVSSWELHPPASVALPSPRSTDVSPFASALLQVLCSRGARWLAPSSADCRSRVRALLDQARMAFSPLYLLLHWLHSVWTWRAAVPGEVLSLLSCVTACSP